MAICYFNGKFLEEKDAKVSINDSGYYFGDGVYEVILLYKGKLIDKDSHLDRLMSSLHKVYFKNTPSKDEVLNKILELLKKNPEIKNASIYMQITRGTSVRAHHFSDLDLQPNFLIKLIPYEYNTQDMVTWKCNIVEDPRRARCDIKMVSLLPMVLAKYESEKAGYDDVLFYNSKVQSMTEGSCFNVYIVDKNDVVITYPLKNEILGGCTRKRILKILEEKGKKFEERCYSKEELYNAKEVFISGALKINSVISVDGKQIGNGQVGEITKWIKQQYIDFMENNN